jgi:hypothetical protein
MADSKSGTTKPSARPWWILPLIMTAIMAAMIFPAWMSNRTMQHAMETLDVR